MSFIDVLIIYLACGAPSSVFEFTRTDHRSAYTQLSLAVISLLFWPVHLCILAGLTIVSVRQRTKERKIHALRQKIEFAMFGDAPPRGVFEFRDTFYRAASLSDAIDSDRRGRSQRETFIAVNHPNPESAARCAARRDQRRMETHLGRTIDELYQVVEGHVLKRGRPVPDADLGDIVAGLKLLIPQVDDRLLTSLSLPSSIGARSSLRSPARNI
jgi:hypothetical protein